MIFKVLALVIEQFSHVWLNFMLWNMLGQQR